MFKWGKSNLLWVITEAVYKSEKLNLQCHLLKVKTVLALCMLGINFRKKKKDDIFKYFSYFFLENKIWHFFLGDNLHEVSDPTFKKK